MRKPRPLSPPLPLARWRVSLIPAIFRIPPPFRRFKADAETGWARAGVPLGNMTLIWAEPWKGCTVVVVEDRMGYRAALVSEDGHVLGSASVSPRATDGHDPRVRGWCIATAEAGVRALRTAAPEPAPVSPDAEAWLRQRLAELDPTPEAPT